MEESIIDDYEAQAKLHGKEFKRPPRALKVTKDDSEIFDKQAQAAYNRLQKKHLEYQFKRD